MNIFEQMERYGHEQLVFCYDRVSGLKLIIGIHDTTLGPALGGCRIWPYSSEADAITDVLRLSRGMTYKNAAMGLDLGGGKSVVIADSRTDKSEAMLRALGKFIATQGGRYITAEDVGTSVQDMSVVALESDFVRGLPTKSGDPSGATAFGVFVAMKAGLLEVFSDDGVSGRHVTVQGLGHVGQLLCQRLHEGGARLTVTDIDPQRLREVADRFDATAVEPDAIFDVEADVFAPCALGAVLNDDTIPRLRVKLVVGSANNQLKEPRHGRKLHERGILYVPDFVANGGGVINVADEMGPGGYQHERAYAKVAHIYDQVREILRICRQDGVLPHEAADRLAEDRIERIGRLKRMFVPRQQG